MSPLPARRSLVRQWLRSTTALVGSLPMLGLTISLAHANPQGGTVAQGSAVISQPDAKTVQVNQSSDRAVIDWKSFSIAAGETTRFIQPSSSSMTLNRVTGDQVSQILGNLQANGRVVLVNPNGIVFGAGSKIDVAALVASTANIKNENFMAGNMKFDIPGKANAQIVNEGTITAADGGLVAIVSPYLRNSGIISARLGKVALAAANGVTLDLYGDNLILFQASDKIASQIVGADGQTVASLIENSGKIYADGGRVLMSANAAKGVVDNAINTTGLISARAVEQQGGEIILKGEDAGIVQVSGTLDASGKEAGQKGGTVNVLGEKVGLLGNASVDVSGDAGGGTALIGGDYQGKGSVRNAQVAYMGQDATLNASALRTGNGGKAILWADGTTRSYGRIFAQGGVNGGDGGFVETSGKSFLDQTGTVNTLAAMGLTGSWLLDPQNIVIATGGGQTLDGTNSLLFADNSGGTSTIAPSVINSATSNVTLQASQDITVSNAISMTNSGKAFIAEAGRNILVNANIATTAGDIFLLGGYDTASGRGAVNQGAIDVNGAQITSGAGQIVMYGKGASGVSDPSSGGQTGIVVRNGGLVQSTQGNVTINGTGGGSAGYGVNVWGGSVTSADGDVFVTGTSSGGGQNATGILVSQSGSNLGNISVTGSGGLRVEGTAAPQTWSYGVLVQGGGQIVHSGTPAAGKKLEVIGTGASAGHMSHGVSLSGSGSIRTKNADMVVSGTASNASAYDSFGIAIGSTLNNAYFVSTGTGTITLIGTSASAGGRSMGISFGGNTYNGEEPGYIQSAGAAVTLSADNIYIRNTTTYGALVRGASSTTQTTYQASLRPTSTSPSQPTPPSPGSNSGSSNSTGSNSSNTQNPSNSDLNGQPGTNQTTPGYNVFLPQNGEYLPPAWTPQAQSITNGIEKISAFTGMTPITISEKIYASRNTADFAIQNVKNFTSDIPDIGIGESTTLRQYINNYLTVAALDNSFNSLNEVPIYDLHPLGSSSFGNENWQRVKVNIVAAKNEYTAAAEQSGKPAIEKLIDSFEDSTKMVIDSASAAVSIAKNISPIGRAIDTALASANVYSNWVVAGVIFAKMPKGDALESLRGAFGGASKALGEFVNTGLSAESGNPGTVGTYLSALSDMTKGLAPFVNLAAKDSSLLNKVGFMSDALKAYSSATKAIEIQAAISKIETLPENILPVSQKAILRSYLDIQFKMAASDAAISVTKVAGNVIHSSTMFEAGAKADEARDVVSAFVGTSIRNQERSFEDSNQKMENVTPHIQAALSNFSEGMKSYVVEVSQSDSNLSSLGPPLTEIPTSWTLYASGPPDTRSSGEGSTSP